MTRISQTMIGAMLFGALAAPAMAQQNGNGMQPSTTQSGEVRGDQPAGQMAGDQAASDPAVPGQTPGRVEGRTSGTMKDRATSREAPGAMGAATPPDSRTVAKAKRNPNNNNSQDPNDAEARGNGQAPTGADANQPAQSTQMPGQQGAQPAPR